MGQEIVNKERSLKFVKEDYQFWRVYLLENHPFYVEGSEVRGGHIDNPDSISWDSWIGSGVLVDNSKILNGSMVEGRFEIRSSTLSNLTIKDAMPDSIHRVSNLIKNSTLNFHAPIEIYTISSVFIEGTFIDGFIEISNVDDKLILKNSCLIGNIDLSDCYDSLELVDCLFNGNLIFKNIDSWNTDHKWESVKIEGSKLVDKLM